MDDLQNQSQTYRQMDVASASASACECECKNVDSAGNSTDRIISIGKDNITNTLGMSSFDADARHRFGQQVRLAMALLDGSGTTVSVEQTGHLTQNKDVDPESITSKHAVLESSTPNAMPADAKAIANRLKILGKDITVAQADQLELLVRYDELEGWRSSGARHCVAWMNLELGISQKLGWEYLRVGRQLRKLPITTALFRAGSLSWSIVRLISRVANADNEGGLCHAALDASVSEVDRLCQGYRWQNNDDAESKNENARTLQQYVARSLTWNTDSNGNTHIRLSLPPELARAFLNSVEHSLGQQEYSEESEDTMTQRRADAAVLMAETSLQSAEKQMATADRYQVIVSVDASELRQVDESDSATSFVAAAAAADTETSPSTSFINTIPPKRPSIHGAGHIGKETARRIACDCSLSAITNLHGEPVDSGRKSRTWAPAMARAIKTRDQHCQYPGCTQTRHLQIHHIQHWADGGSTCIDNGVCLCSAHHRIVHEGGYRIDRVDDQSQWLDEQFIRQKSTQKAANAVTTNQTNKVDPNPINNIEALLRNSRESFDYIRRMSPSRFRFRVVDCDGRDIRDSLCEQVQNEPAECERQSHKRAHSKQRHDEKVQGEKINRHTPLVYKSNPYDYNSNNNKSVVEEGRESYCAYANEQTRATILSMNFT